MLTFLFPFGPTSKHLMSGANNKWAKLSGPLIQRTFDLELRNRFDSLMDEATISNDTISQVKKQADAFNTALKHASEKVLWKKSKKKYAVWVSPQIIELLNTLQGQLSAAFNLDQHVHLDAHLAALELADKKHEHGTALQIINKIAGDVNTADPSEVRLQNGAVVKMDFVKKYLTMLL